jgi:hypothetical protein
LNWEGLNRNIVGCLGAEIGGLVKSGGLGWVMRVVELELQVGCSNRKLFGLKV